MSTVSHPIPMWTKTKLHTYRNKVPEYKASRFNRQAHFRPPETKVQRLFKIWPVFGKLGATRPISNQLCWPGHDPGAIRIFIQLISTASLAARNLVFSFHPSLPICVGVRLVGSKARFIRRSCRPNCKISTVVVDKTKVKFAVFSTESIEAGSELTINWEWDQKHPVRKLIDDGPPDQLTKQEKLFLEHVAEMANRRGA